MGDNSLSADRFSWDQRFFERTHGLPPAPGLECMCLAVMIVRPSGAIARRLPMASLKVVSRAAKLPRKQSAVAVGGSHGRSTQARLDQAIKHPFRL